MKYIGKWKLHKNGVVNQGQQYFVCRWLELFHCFTIDAFRYRAMNSYSIINELLTVIAGIEKGVWHEMNVKLVCKEALDIIKNDLVLKNSSYIAGILRALQDGINHKAKIEERMRLKIALLGIHTDLKRRYWQALKDGLKSSINYNDFDQIEWFISALATYLIDVGHEREFMYQSCDDILNDSQQRDFPCFYEQLLQKIEPIDIDYTTIMKLNGDYAGLNGFFLEYEFQNTIDIDNPQVNSFISKEPVLYAIKHIKAVDPNAAAVIAQTKMANLLDVLYYSHPKAKISSDPICLVKDNEKLFLCNVSANLVGYDPNQNWLNKANNQLTKILRSSVLSDESKDKLLGTLRYFRLSYACGNTDQQFLNLWIALEHMTKGSENQRSMIDSIANFIPKTLSLNYINRISRDTIENLFRSGINVPEPFRKVIETRNIAEFISLMKEEKTYQEMAISASNNSLLFHRLEKLRNILLSSNNIKIAIEKNCEDISHHLARMYRFRNYIVHYAARDLKIMGITANLHTYVRTLLNILLYEISNYECFQDLHGVYMKYQLVFDQYMEGLDKNDPKVLEPTMIANPLLLLWPGDKY
ncbi:MAG: hypothetical protein PHZ03_02410 [Syntrophomonas sp.]|nr:hypothetical protein [Syntrophomonas sp.]